jgi:phosphate transport system permease protein
MSAAPPQPPPPAAPPVPQPGRRGRSNFRLLRLGDFLFGAVSRTAAVSVLVVAALLVFFIARASLPALRHFGWGFLTSTAWDVPHLQFGALPFVVGTLITSALAMVLAVPISVAAATFLAEIAPGWVRRGASFLVELLAAIPSVIYGFWGIFFLVPIIKVLYEAVGIHNSTGRTVFTASVILAIMIVPYIAAITYDVCRAVPQSQREGALAVGATRWQMIWRVVLPYARPGIIAACFLALGRALGETMAVAMLIGNNPRLSWDIFGPGSTIPSVVANELPGATYELHKSALVALGLVLFVVTVIVNVLARLLLWRVGGGKGKRPLLARLFGAAGAPTPPASAAAPAPAASANGRATIQQVAASHRGAARWTNRVMTWALGGCLVLTLIPLFHIFGYITFRGFSSINLAFFTNLPSGEPLGRDTWYGRAVGAVLGWFGAAPTGPGLGHSLYGTAVMVGLASLGAMPLGILAALFLTEFRTSRLAPVVRFVGELLSGVPSVIVGIFAYALIVVPLNFSAYAGAFALGVLMIPIVMRSAEEALKLVPAALRNGSYALGASHAQTVLRVLLPTALPTIITGICLAVARIAGETAPLLFTAGNRQYMPRGLGDKTPFLTYYIYNYALSEDPQEKQLAWAGALVLLILVMLLNVGIRALTGKRMLSATRAD